MDEENLSQKKRVEKALLNLTSESLEPGRTIAVSKFEDWLGISRTHQAFGYTISAIRHALFGSGIYLSGEGSTESGNYFIEDPRDHYWLSKLAIAKAERNLEGMQTLLANTPTKGFSELQKRRHENVLRELSLKLSAFQQAKEVEEILNRRKLRGQVREIVSDKIAGEEPIS